MYRYHNSLKNFNPFVITSVFVLFLIVMFTFAIPTLINAASTMMNFIAIIFIGNDILVGTTQCHTTLYFGSKPIRHLTMAYNLPYLKYKVKVL